MRFTCIFHNNLHCFCEMGGRIHEKSVCKMFRVNVMFKILLFSIIHRAKKELSCKTEALTRLAFEANEWKKEELEEE